MVVRAAFLYLIMGTKDCPIVEACLRPCCFPVGNSILIVMMDSRRDWDNRFSASCQTPAARRLSVDRLDTGDIKVTARENDVGELKSN